MMSNLSLRAKILWNSITTDDPKAEFAEIKGVLCEIGGKLYSKLIEFAWDMGEISKYERKLKTSTDYKSWEATAKKIDSLKGKDEWKLRDDSEKYDYKLLRRRLKLLQNLREQDDIPALVHHLRSGLMRSLGGSLNPDLYQKTLADTKQLIQDYQKEVCTSLIHVFQSQKFNLKQKIEFFSESRYAFGKSALMLSGGGGLGMYHLGVVKALYDLDLLPRIIAGTSAGSVVAAMVAIHNYEEIPKIFSRGYIRYGPFMGLEKGSITRKIKRLLTKGYFMDIKIFENFLRENLMNYTFQEAFDKTGIILNITVSGHGEHDDFRLLNYLTAPHVLIWSACCASCAIPFVFQPVELKCKNHLGHIVPYHPPGLKFVDGSIKADLPMMRLAEQFNVNAFIVSQTNAYVVPLMTQDDGGGSWGNSFHFKFYRLFKRLLQMELKHRVAQLNTLGIFKFVTGWLGVFTQDYRGHCTIWPVPSFKDYANILSNPSEDDIVRCIQGGMLRTFPKMKMLKSILGIEKTFDYCYRELKKQLQLGSLRIAIPVDQEEDMDIRKRDSPLRPTRSFLQEISDLWPNTHEKHYLEPARQQEDEAY